MNISLGKIIAVLWVLGLCFPLFLTWSNELKAIYIIAYIGSLCLSMISFKLRDIFIQTEE